MTNNEKTRKKHRNITHRTKNKDSKDKAGNTQGTPDQKHFKPNQKTKRTHQDTTRSISPEQKLRTQSENNHTHPATPTTTKKSQETTTTTRQHPEHTLTGKHPQHNQVTPRTTQQHSAAQVWSWGLGLGFGREESLLTGRTQQKNDTWCGCKTARNLDVATLENGLSVAKGREPRSEGSMNCDGCPSLLRIVFKNSGTRLMAPHTCSSLQRLTDCGDKVRNNLVCTILLVNNHRLPLSAPYAGGGGPFECITTFLSDISKWKPLQYFFSAI